MLSPKCNVWVMYYYYYYYYTICVSCHRHFFLILLLNQRWSPPLRLQASHCSTFRIMCDVPSISESIEFFPGIVSSSLLMSFLWCMWNTTPLPSSPLGSIGFICSISFHFLARFWCEMDFEMVRVEFPRSGYHSLQCCQRTSALSFFLVVYYNFVF